MDTGVFVFCNIIDCFIQFSSGIEFRNSSADITWYLNMYTYTKCKCLFYYVMCLSIVRQLEEMIEFQNK